MVLAMTAQLLTHTLCACATIKHPPPDPHKVQLNNKTPQAGNGAHAGSMKQPNQAVLDPTPQQAGVSVQGQQNKHSIKTPPVLVRQLASRSHTRSHSRCLQAAAAPCYLSNSCLQAAAAPCYLSNSMHNCRMKPEPHQAAPAAYGRHPTGQHPTTFMRQHGCCGNIHAAHATEAHAKDTKDA
jgi:hypothetical protein